jgi:hypothetical protein
MIEVRTTSIHPEAMGCGRDRAPSSPDDCRGSTRDPKTFTDCLRTEVIVAESSQSGVVPDVDLRPLKKLDPNPTALLHLLERWRDWAIKAGRAIDRIVLAFEVRRDATGRAGYFFERSTSQWLPWPRSPNAIGSPRPVSLAALGDWPFRRWALFVGARRRRDVWPFATNRDPRLMRED